ncbi:MAG: hypothetical protein VX519_07405 [Myxococcota bacterium]|nr:hypothetical protein [Myxococcota bacterium]
MQRPVHIDEANFLRLAQGARLNPWRPHDIAINWQGTQQAAFDVLSNPPGIAWWLAVLPESAPIPMLHLWMLPWLMVALWGCHRLGNALVGEGTSAVLVLGTSPIVVLSAQSLTPDLPLLACTVAGIGGFLGKRSTAAWFAGLAGCAVLFRYSGVCLIPLLLLLGWQRNRLRAALPVMIPISLLAIHDLAAYDKVHLFSMVGFQSVSDTPRDVFRKGVASLAMLGGAGMLPFLARGRPALIGASLGALVGIAAGFASGQTGGVLGATVAFAAAGGASISVIRLRDDVDRFLFCWAIGGLVFLLTLRFTASRYWLPFLPAIVLAALRMHPSPRFLFTTVLVGSLLSFGLSIDENAMARAQQTAAQAVASKGTGSFSGHWGWQYHLEKAGWQPLEEGATPSGLHAVAQAPWPQETHPEACLIPIEKWSPPDTWWGPRTHSAIGAANFHAFMISGTPPIETYSPWTFSSEPYDTVTLFEPCP